MTSDNTTHRKDSYVFLHIGKTAGSTVRGALATVFPTEVICPLVFHKQITDMPIEDRDQYELFSAHIGFDLAGELASEPGNIFTLLRDPVDRVISLYYYWREIEGDRGGPVFAKELPFLEFLDSDKAAVVVDVHNTQTWQIAFSHDSPTRRKLKAHLSEDEVFKQALDNIEQMKVIGVQEHIEQFRGALEAAYGWNLPELHKLNTTQKRERREEVPFEIKRKIQSLNAMDIELYAYVLKHYVLS